MKPQTTVLYHDVAPKSLKPIIEFFAGSKGFTQKTWSRVTQMLSPDRSYSGSIGQEQVRVVTEGSDFSWLYIGLGMHKAVRVPLYGPKRNHKTVFWIDGETLILAVYEGDEVMFERHLKRQM